MNSDLKTLIIGRLSLQCMEVSFFGKISQFSIENFYYSVVSLAVYILSDRRSIQYSLCIIIGPERRPDCLHQTGESSE